MVEIFREVRRVLHPSGTVWVNMGDSYNGSGGAGGDYNEGGLKEGQPRYPGRNVGTLKPKDLVGIPWMLAFALRADGWWLRDAVIWAKAEVGTDEVPMFDMPIENDLNGSSMPGSQQDRCTNSYEFIFQLTKQSRCYFDPEGCKTASGAMLRNVWRMNTKSYKEAHFATYTPELPERAIKLSTSEKGVCPRCRNPWRRVVETKRENYKVFDHPLRTGHVMGGGVGKNFPDTTRTTLGWQPTCEHDLEPVPALVLDPFIGSGTTCVVARKLGRNSIGLDLSYPYLLLARERLGLTALEQWEQGKDGKTSLAGLR
jgi:DNA modification methylase